MGAMNRALIVLGAVLIVVGLLWPKLRSLPLFRLPGDIVIDRPGLRFYFPFTSMLILSLLVTLLLWLFRR